MESDASLYFSNSIFDLVSNFKISILIIFSKSFSIFISKSLVFDPKDLVFFSNSF